MNLTGATKLFKVCCGLATPALGNHEWLCTSDEEGLIATQIPEVSTKLREHPQLLYIKDHPSWKTINGCVCNGLMSTEPGKPIGTKLSFQINHASICGTIMPTFVLDAMPVKAAFQSALSKDIVA
ncbi:transposable element Tcb2 transposase [Trichonephila clavipes]|nr:transposable element Tcb2 transposase [Trichonephila clavipes]